jgi:hypothetical protein
MIAKPTKVEVDTNSENNSVDANVVSVTRYTRIAYNNSTYLGVGSFA